MVEAVIYRFLRSYFRPDGTLQSWTRMKKIESGDFGGTWRDWIIAHALIKKAKGLTQGGAETKDGPK